MSSIDDLLSAIPMDQLAGLLGVDPATADGAARTALPALLNGMQANAQDPDGLASLVEAIGGHDSSLVDGGVDLDQVDAADGEKIVGHVFGDNRDEVVNRLAGGGQGAVAGKLLPLLAPIVMSYLAKRMLDRRGSASAGDAGGGGGGLADLLGSVLGGGGGGGGRSGGGIDIGDLLGGLLGGGRR